MVPGSWLQARPEKGVAPLCSDRFGFQTDASVAPVRGGTARGPPGPQLNALPVYQRRSEEVCGPWVVPPQPEFIFNLLGVFLMEKCSSIRIDND